MFRVGRGVQFSQAVESGGTFLCDGKKGGGYNFCLLRFHLKGDLQFKPGASV